MSTALHAEPSGRDTDDPASRPARVRWWLPAAGGAATGLAAGLLLALAQRVVVVPPSASATLTEAGPTTGTPLLLVLSLVLGAVTGLVVGHRPRGQAGAAAVGLLLGLLGWLLWSLTVAPLLAGGPVTWTAEAAAASFGPLVAALFTGGVAALGAQLASVRLAPGGTAGRTERAPALPTRRVLVLGGGFAGVAVTQRLEQRLARRPDIEVALVSASNSLLFTPMLAEVAAGTLQARHVSAPLRAACPDTVIHRAVVEGVDPARHVVRLRADGADEPTELGYDQLVLALGATAHYRDLPGLAEHAWPLKTVDDALRLREHVIALLERADVEPDPAERQRQLTFVVAGGGFAGAELVAELVDLVHDVRRYYPRIDPTELRFVLVHSQDRILPELDRSLADFSLDQLRDRGIEAVLGARVASAGDDHVALADGRTLPTRTLVWTAGNRPNPLLATLPVPTVKSGAVACEPTLRVQGHDTIWALGDGAAVPDLDNEGSTHPPTAQHALREGKVAADNIVAALHGRPAKPFRFRTIGLLVALGHQQGAAQFRGVQFSGLLAWLLWRSVYLSKLPGLERRLRVALDWTLDLFFPRDVVLTQPAGTSRSGGHQ